MAYTTGSDVNDKKSPCSESSKADMILRLITSIWKNSIKLVVGITASGAINITFNNALFN